MQLRISRIKRNGKTFQYAQLVESFRRESDGMPMHRVIASLGSLPQIEVDNLRSAIQAARQGKRVLVSQLKPAAERVPKIIANLRYLDLAVFLSLWNQWRLSDVFDQILPTGQGNVAPGAVVAALVLQRCADPGSKLFATRWFPKTALPELLGVSPAAFNNTRVHRVLDDLDAGTVQLMSRLPSLYQQQDGAFVSLFLDVTDAWFTGHGPPLALRGKTKMGFVERKIGIVLLCDQRGYPLRWQVVQGTRNDSRTMGDMMKAMAGLNWVGSTPVVCDRAMGKTAHLREMAATGLRFVTALTTTEFGAYASRLPHEQFAAFSFSGDSAPNQVASQVEQVAARALQAGLQRVQETLYIADLGIVERPADRTAPRPDSSEASIAEVMSLCRRMCELVSSGQAPSYVAAANSMGLSQSMGNKYCLLRRLSEQIQQEILAGKADARNLAELLCLTSMQDQDEQRRAFDELLASPPPLRRPLGVTARQSTARPTEPPPLRVRVVVCFNPERFVAERTHAQERLVQIQDFVQELNLTLARPESRQKHKNVVTAIENKLRGYDLLDAFDVEVAQQTAGHGRAPLTVSLKLKPEAWARRRQHDGFSVIVAHPDVSLSPAEISLLYRNRDVVEKDFQTIKSVVELRPIWHRSESKVRAHVTLCMLALLLERTLKARLSEKLTTAYEATETLKDCYLNRYAVSADQTAYTLTDLSPDQRRILKALGLQHLGDNEAVAEKFAPR